MRKFLIGIVLLISLGSPLVENNTSLSPIRNGFMYIQENSLIATNLSYIPKYQVLGTAVDETLYHIIRCESNFRPEVCNEKCGCSCGAGLCQFIRKTWLETIDRMGELLPERCRNMEAVFDGKCNLIACQWLYNQDGDIHWRAYSGECYLK